ncbi:unnamed protein product [Closterium sp. Yama58-4]|nr:unnamed protein product [Closterium sp. Yama58-4]
MQPPQTCLISLQSAISSHHSSHHSLLSSLSPLITLSSHHSLLSSLSPLITLSSHHSLLSSLSPLITLSSHHSLLSSLSPLITLSSHHTLLSSLSPLNTLSSHHSLLSSLSPLITLSSLSQHSLLSTLSPLNTLSSQHSLLSTLSPLNTLSSQHSLLSTLSPLNTLSSQHSLLSTLSPLITLSSQHSLLSSLSPLITLSSHHSLLSSHSPLITLSSQHSLLSSLSPLITLSSHHTLLSTLSPLNTLSSQHSLLSTLSPLNTLSSQHSLLSTLSPLNTLSSQHSLLSSLSPLNTLSSHHPLRTDPSPSLSTPIHPSLLPPSLVPPSLLPSPPLCPSTPPHQTIISSIVFPIAMDSDVTVTLIFFPPLDDPTWVNEPARSQKTRIRNLFDSHKLSLGSAIGPYTIKGFYGPDDPPANVTSPAPPASDGISIAVVVGIVAAGVAILALLLVGLTWLLLRRQKKRDWWGKEDYEAIEGLNLVGVERFKLAQLADATQGFKTLLGEGGYGQVYHGQLPSGEKVAVKRAKPGVQVNGKEFRNEIELLSAVRHRNLVLLKGFCVEAGEQLLVYEFIEKGTLEDILRGKSGIHLTWQQRLDMACGAARGFAYLHHQIKPPIIHRDVKTANILITAAGEAKVADFGISKAVMEGEQMDTQVKGTVGYLDPEYYMSDLLTEKSDVFSFGIVLLEIATGLRPISDNQHIRQLVIKRVMAGGRGATSVIDPALLRQSQGANFGGIPEEVEVTFEWFLKLGMRCSARLSQDRPTMQHVAAELDAMRARVIQIVRLRGGTNGASTGVITTGASSTAFSTGTSVVSEEQFWEDMANEGALVPGFDNDDEKEMEYGQEIYDNMTREKGEGQGRQGTRGVSGSVSTGGYTSSSSEGVWRAGGSTTGWTSDSAPSREI